MTLLPELAGCPFCGADGKHIERSNPMSKWRHSIDCSSTTCGMSGPVEATKADAIAAWNTRATSTARLSGVRIGLEGWQDIATAPRDNEYRALILWNGRQTVPGFAWEGGWADCWYDWMNPQPTHWMPLPPPPETIAEDADHG